MCWGIYPTPQAAAAAAAHAPRLLPAARRDADGRARPRRSALKPLARVAAGCVLAAWPLTDRAARADRIILTNGRVIDADRTWYDGTQLRYEKNGGTYGLPRSLVKSVESDARPGAPPPGAVARPRPSPRPPPPPARAARRAVPAPLRGRRQRARWASPSSDGWRTPTRSTRGGSVSRPTTRSRSSCRWAPPSRKAARRSGRRGPTTARSACPCTGWTSRRRSWCACCATSSRTRSSPPAPPATARPGCRKASRNGWKAAIRRGRTRSWRPPRRSGRLLPLLTLEAPVPVPARERRAARLRGEPLRRRAHHPHPRRGGRGAPAGRAGRPAALGRGAARRPRPQLSRVPEELGSPAAPAGFARAPARRGRARAERRPSRGTSRGSAAGRSRSRPSGR